MNGSASVIVVILDEKVEGALEWAFDGLKANLRLQALGLDMTAEDRDLYECLRSIRLGLEESGVRICCNGARIDAYPSRLNREMGGAQKVQIRVMGRAAMKSDQVGIFDPAPIDSIGSVDQQNGYYREWLNSLRV
jgi:hypothetical protein